MNLQHRANNLSTPKKMYSNLGETVRKYFKAIHGERTSFARKPLLRQDVEHMIDTCGIETPNQLQGR